LLGVTVNRLGGPPGGLGCALVSDQLSGHREADRVADVPSSLAITNDRLR